MRFQFTLWTFPSSFILLFWFGTPLSRSGFGIWLHQPPAQNQYVPAIGAPGINDGPDFIGPRP